MEKPQNVFESEGRCNFRWQNCYGFWQLKWITGPAKQLVHRLRHEHQAILIGSETLLKMILHLIHVIFIKAFRRLKLSWTVVRECLDNKAACETMNPKPFG